MSGLRDEIAKVLAAHEPGNERIHYGSAKRLADSLAKLVEREIAAARGEAWEAGAKAGHHSPLTWFALRQVNPYRAALSPDPDRGEGEVGA